MLGTNKSVVSRRIKLESFGSKYLVIPRRKF